jgi:hypothetical protein
VGKCVGVEGKEEDGEERREERRKRKRVYKFSWMPDHANLGM